MPEGTIDIPLWAQVETIIICKNHFKHFLLLFQSKDEYCATLAHKVNHSFEPNAKFDAFATTVYV